MKKITDDWLNSAESDLQLILLDQLYIDSRYPGQLGLLPNGKPTLHEAMDFCDLGVQLFDAAKTICKIHTSEPA